MTTLKGELREYYMNAFHSQKSWVLTYKNYYWSSCSLLLQMLTRSSVLSFNMRFTSFSCLFEIYVWLAYFSVSVWYICVGICLFKSVVNNENWIISTNYFGNPLSDFNKHFAQNLFRNCNSHVFLFTYRIFPIPNRQYQLEIMVTDLYRDDMHSVI